MKETRKPASPLRRPFVAGGAIVGVFLTAWYLYNNFGRYNPVPDPVWVKAVNIALFMFCSIYVANLLRRLVEFLFRRKS